MTMFGWLILAVFVPALVWVTWGWVAYHIGLLDLGPDDALHATFSPTFWRTGDLPDDDYRFPR